MFHGVILVPGQDQRMFEPLKGAGMAARSVIQRFRTGQIEWKPAVSEGSLFLENLALKSGLLDVSRGGADASRLEPRREADGTVRYELAVNDQAVLPVNVARSGGHWERPDAADTANPGRQFRGVSFAL